MYNRGRIKIIIPIILGILLIPTIIILGKSGKHASAGNTPSYLTFENFNPKAKLGTEENPFIILEIVPCRWMGQIGYVIDGQEPAEPTALNIGDIKGFAGDVIVLENGTVKNTEIFKKKVLNLTEEECADYHIRVVTITPDILNENVAKFSKYYDLSHNGKNNKVIEKVTKGEIDLIGNADLISISPKAHGGESNAIKIWNLFRRDKSEATASASYLNFEENDLSWQTTMELFMKVGVVSDSAVLVYDITILQAPNYQFKNVDNKINNVQGFCHNFYKLLLMIRQSDPEKLFTDYFSPDNGVPMITHNQSVDSGSYNDLSDNATIYWNEYTFLPAFIDGTYPKNDFTEDYKRHLKSKGYLIENISGRCSDSVIRNAFSYNGGASMVQMFTSDRTDIALKEVVVSETDVRSNYNEELFDFLEEKAKKIDTNAPRPTLARPCEALEYLLSKKKEKYKESITVLDLEPCNDFTLTEEQVRAMLPSFTGTIDIEQQTTAEFIGKTEDITQIYDLIYIGTNTGKMNKDGTSKTIYNDPLLDGYIYLHVGDRVVGYDTFKGSQKNQSGSIDKAINHINFNNLAFNKMNILKSFSNSIKELPNSTDLYRYSGNDITKLKEKLLVEYLDAGYPVLLENELYTSNNEVIDDQSNLYNFLSTCKEDKYKNQVFNRKDFTDNTGSTKTMKTKLMALVQKEKLSVKLTNNPVEYQPDDSSTLIADKKLKFNFEILPLSDSSDADYNWSVFAGDECIMKSNIPIKAGAVSFDMTLPPDYKGVVPWKLLVERVDNPNIRWTETGFAACKVPSMNETLKEKTRIDVLQITSNVSTNNLQELMNPGPGKTSLLYKFTKNLDDFNIAITTVSVDEFVNQYKKGGKYNVSKPKTDQLKNYDMLIFGFGDCYSDISNEYGALNNIQDFINSGKSVMLSHDTTSFVNLPKEEYEDLNKKPAFWGYGMNQYVRSIAGMDRFNALRQMQNTSIYDEAIMPERISYDAISKGIYKNYIRSKDNRLCYPEMQGLTNGCLVAYSNPDYPIGSIHILNKDYPPLNKGNDFINGTGINKYNTNYVTRVNEGHITSYPYDIPDSFKGSNTHLQSYQLNMDDPEITVWFCLSDNKTDGPYSTSPNDVRNNYYVYSKGNIMYTGVGHSKMDAVVAQGTSSGYSEDEVKLFINTMIASYSNCIAAPTVEITNSEAQKSSDGYVWYQHYQKPRNIAHEKKQIKFKAYDINMSSNDLVARIYKVKVENNTTSIELIEPTGSSGVRVLDSTTNIAVPIYNGAGELGHNIKADIEYTFEYSMEDFSQNGSAELFITVTNKNNLTGDATLKLLNRILFDLD